MENFKNCNRAHHFINSQAHLGGSCRRWWFPGRHFGYGCHPHLDERRF